MEDSDKKAVSSYLEKQILLSPDLIGHFSEFGDLIFPEKEMPSFLYANKDILYLLRDHQGGEMNWLDLEKAMAIYEKGVDQRPYLKFMDYLKDAGPSSSIVSSVKLVTSFSESSSKKEVCDFSMYFNARLDTLQKILCARDEMKGLTSISRILSKTSRESVSLIGLVKDKQVTKNGNYMLTIEDNTGEIKVLVNRNKQDILDISQDLVLDEVIGITGVTGDKIVFANTLLLPDIPVTNELKKCNEEGFAVFLADLHVGSNNFLSKDFDRFLAWINMEAGNEKQKSLASKVKYVFIAGDLVDGVGVYPGQEDELDIKDVREQYKLCARLLSKIPSAIQIIICPGNHDALRIAEPQPPLQNEFCEEIMKLRNVTLVSNPAVVNIHSSNDFQGYNVLMYHGYSFDHYIANVDSIRNNGGYDRADLIMKFLLKRRHLAPTHASTLYVPYSDIDPLAIHTVPDFFITGHIHKSAVSSYKNVTLICCSCWQSKTSFQEKVGHHPEPSRVPVVNLATREIKILRFGE